MDLVSVIIPTYNRASTVGRAVESILEQGYGPLEVIVVDDGSTDDTPRALEPFHNRIRVIRQANGGVSAARNRGIEASQAPFIAFCDSDDRWLPGKLQAQMALLAHRPEVGVVTCGLRVLSPQGEVMAVDQGLDFPERDFAQRIFYRNIIPGPTSVVIRRPLLDQAGLFDESLRTVEDWDLWVRLAQRARFAIIREIYIEKFQSDDRLTSDLGSMVECTLRFMDRHFPEDVRGLEAFLLRRRMVAEMYLINGAELDGRDDALFRRYLLRSLWSYPSPLFRPERYVALVRTTLGTSRYRRLMDLLGRGKGPMSRWM